MALANLIDSPVPWGLAGLAIGIFLGVTTLSVSLIALGLAGFLVYLWRHGPAEESTEGRLFASGPIFITAWLAGFILRGIAF